MTTVRVSGLSKVTAVTGRLTLWTSPPFYPKSRIQVLALSQCSVPLRTAPLFSPSSSGQDQGTWPFSAP